MTAAATTRSPYVLAPTTVATTQRRSSSFARLTFAGPALVDVGVDGPLYDQRIKLLIPPADGDLPDLAHAGDDWYAAWQALPPHARGTMRTYSLRDLTGRGPERRLTVDVVLHLDPDASGTVAAWAAAARPGDPALLVAPRAGQPAGGIEFDPGDASRLLLVADETAVPAVARILHDLPGDARGTAFCEVPHRDDVDPDVTAPPGVEVRWLPRDGDPDVGCRLLPAVAAHLGPGRRSPSSSPAAAAAHDPDAPVWDTPGRAGPGAGRDGGITGRYAWIAGEAGMVTTLRRHLVHDLGVSRQQVAFMGYWRRGRPSG